MPDLAMQLIADEEVIFTIIGDAKASKSNPLNHDTEVKWEEVYDKKNTRGVSIKRGQITTLGDAEEELLELGGALYSGTRTKWGVCYEIRRGRAK